MAIKTHVEMRLCRRVAGVIKCVDKGYYAGYEEKTVGPVTFSITYPA